MKLVFTVFLVLYFRVVLAQNTGILEGRVFDDSSKEIVVGASVSFIGRLNQKVTITDENGFFKIESVPFGVHRLVVRHLTYEIKDVNDIAIYDIKGSYIEVFLTTSTNELDEVIVSASTNPTLSTDPLATVSARSISSEETKRFAGSLGDPSRMALSYSGVNSGRGDNNEIIIRGNSAKYLQWKLEGLEIPNPNHFGVYGSSGGLLSILNGSNLGRSNFYLGAFPAHTGNALAGVFDLSLKNGSLTNYKYSFEIGLIGLSASSEGPIKLVDGANYKVNYRYSTLGLMKELGVFFQAPVYQDLTFKLNFPTKKAGLFSIYGLAGLGTSLEEEFFRKIDSTRSSINNVGRVVYGFDEIRAKNLKQYNIGIAGIKHTIPIGSKHLLTNHINYSAIYNAPRNSDINRDDFTIFLKSQGRFKNSTVRYQPEFTTYINSNNSIHIGATTSFSFFSAKLNEGFADHSINPILESSSTSFLGQSYISYKITSIKRIKIVAGIHHTFFNLNNQTIFEPRIGIDYTLTDNSTLALASGMHSATESPEVYLVTDDSLNVSSRNLKMSRSWQSVLSYKRKLSERLFLTAELYAQYLYDIPIALDSSNFSLINEEVALTNIPLINNGKGLNYGLEVTLEKLFSDSYYFLMTASLFQSEYKLMEQFYRKTNYANSYVLNVLGGKELRLEPNKFLGFNIRANFSGGRPYTPVLLDESIAAGHEIRDNQRKNFGHLPDYIGVDFSMNYRWIRSKLSHEIKLDIFRLFEQNYLDEVYVSEKLNRDGSISPANVKLLKYGEGQTSSTLLPVLYYKITF